MRLGPVAPTALRSAVVVSARSATEGGRPLAFGDLVEKAFGRAVSAPLGPESGPLFGPTEREEKGPVQLLRARSLEPP
jgi:hypothetical protein